MKVLKNTGIKAFLVFLTFTLLFASCEQDALQNVTKDLDDNLINNATVNTDGAPLRCGTVFTEEQIAYIDRTTKDTETFLESRQTEEVSVPIVNHIVRRTNGTGGLTDEELSEIMENLTTFYGEFGVHFTTCDLEAEAEEIKSDEYYDLQILGNYPVGTNNLAESYTLSEQHDEAHALNIYYIGGNMEKGALPVDGVSVVPSETNGNQPARVFVTADAAKANEKVLEHEIGHIFSLYHTHSASSDGCAKTQERVTRDAPDANCEGSGDRLCDTPADPNLSSQCHQGNPIFVNSDNCTYVGGTIYKDDLGVPFNPDVTNVMSYSPRSCTSSFTDGQEDKVKTSIMKHYSLECCNSPSPNSCCTPSNSLIKVRWNRKFKNFKVDFNFNGEWKIEYAIKGTFLPDGDESNTFIGSGSYFIFYPLPGTCHYDLRFKRRCGYNDTGWSSWSEARAISCHM